MWCYCDMLMSSLLKDWSFKDHIEWHKRNVIRRHNAIIWTAKLNLSCLCASSNSFRTMYIARQNCASFITARDEQSCTDHLLTVHHQGEDGYSSKRKIITISGDEWSTLLSYQSNFKSVGYLFHSLSIHNNLSITEFARSSSLLSLNEISCWLLIRGIERDWG